jgi:hypothetical protein
MKFSFQWWHLVFSPFDCLTPGSVSFSAKWKSIHFSSSCFLGEKKAVWLVDCDLDFPHHYKNVEWHEKVLLLDRKLQSNVSNVTFFFASNFVNSDFFCYGIYINWNSKNDNWKALVTAADILLLLAKQMCLKHFVIWISDYCCVLHLLLEWSHNN